MDNQQKYHEERSLRWGMARGGERQAADAASGMLQAALGMECTNRRYDVLWHDRYHIGDPENPWVRGAPDYLLILGGTRFAYGEIKIKSRKFHKTVRGGVTDRGTKIPCYGCESFYLDRIPVYENMCAFARKTGIDPQTFLLLFVSEDFSEIYAISLAEIQDLVENGYQGEPLGEIQEGYGTQTAEGTAPSYLIPVDVTRLIAPDNKEYFWAHSSDSWMMPKERYFACTENRWFYHRDRHCKYIANKENKELTYFDCEEQARASGRKRCRTCFQGE